MIKLKITIFIMIAMNLASGGVWTTSHADVDGDNIDEGIDYVIGVEGEHNIPYVYGPHNHFVAWNTTRTAMSVFALQQVVMNDNTIILDTGEPKLIGEVFYYVNKFYDTMNSYWEGNNIVTRWVSQHAILERHVKLNDSRGINRYKLWSKNSDGSTTYLGETALIVTWNDGMTTIDQARNYVLTQLQNLKAVYNDSFAGLTASGKFTFKVIYKFDDYVAQLDEYSVLCWDGWNCQQPSSPAIWGTLHVPGACSLYCEYFSSPCTEHVYAIWKSPSGVQTSIQIKPEVINLKSHGKFTAFITLPSGYKPSDIDISTVRCEGAPAVSGIITPNSLITKFNVQDLVGVEPGPAVAFLVTGLLHDGTPFLGCDTVCVILPEIIALSIHPNPCHIGAPVIIKYLSPQLDVLTINRWNAQIYDEAGRAIRTFSNTTQADNEFVWDLRDNSGKTVCPGVYFCRFDVKESVVTQKIVVVP